MFCTWILKTHYLTQIRHHQENYLGFPARNRSNLTRQKESSIKLHLCCKCVRRETITQGLSCTICDPPQNTVPHTMLSSFLQTGGVRIKHMTYITRAFLPNPTWRFPWENRSPKAGTEVVACEVWTWSEEAQGVCKWCRYTRPPFKRLTFCLVLYTSTLDIKHILRVQFKFTCNFFLIYEYNENSLLSLHRAIKHYEKAFHETIAKMLGMMLLVYYVQ